MRIAIARHVISLVAIFILVLAPLSTARADETRVPAKLLGYREISLGEGRLKLPDIWSVKQVLVRDSWTSRYQETVVFDGGAYLRFEWTRFPYDSEIPLSQVLHELFDPDVVLEEQGLRVRLGEAAEKTVGRWPLAYLAQEGKTAACFSFASQFGETPLSSLRYMLSGQDCRPKGSIGPEQLRDAWFGFLSQVTVR